MLARTVLCVVCVLFVVARGDSLPEVRLNADGDFVDPSGRIKLFHGFNSVYKKRPYYNAADVNANRLKFFRQWGFNVVRLGALWHPAFPTGPGKVNDTYLKAIEDQVDKFAEAGIYVILDMHQDSLSSMYGSYDAIPLWLLESFPRPRGFLKYPWPKRSMPSGDWEGYVTFACQKAFQCIYDNHTNAWKHWGDFWVEIARRFKDKSNVLGYELINEPFAGNIYTNPLRGIPGYAGKHNLAPVYDYLVERIRSVDERKFIFFEGVTWSVIGTARADSFAGPGFKRVPGGDKFPQEYGRSVFSYHYYCPLIEMANTKIFSQLIMPKMFYSVKGIAKQLKSGRFLTEFGICVPDGNPKSINTIECNAVMNGADANLQSWTYWDSQFFDTDDKPIINQASLLSRQFFRLMRTQSVKPFARFYPMATGGTPINLKFDVATGSGSYAFLTNEVTEALSKQGKAIASIFLPLELYYPQGYEVDVVPSTFTYSASNVNDHIIEVFAPADGIMKDVVAEINVRPTQMPRINHLAMLI
ncbi:unnamed protein product [Mesocestoides corti]|uniref:Cellulase domain-containing protein n=1 Tax=Mesocestoides corti TaxID=53468 RepID=A0A0R3UP07_MESCO|nr:unnamed protein product [Mesocestoides corti]